GAAKRSLEVKRTVCTKLLEQNFYPYTKRYLGNFNAHFSTIGLIGMNEMCLNASWVKQNIASQKGLKFSQDVLDFMREELKRYQEETGNLYNLEATPAESTTYRLAKMDRERWPEIKTASIGKEKPFYTNSCHLPVDYTTDPFEALEIQDQLQTRFTGGTVFHTFLGEKLPSWEAAAKLVRKISYTFKLPYFTISPTYTICNKCGYFAGEHDMCPKCGDKVEVYSRITGYYRPIEHWNEGKKQEYEKRKEYVPEHEKMRKISDSGNHVFKRGERVETAQETLFTTGNGKLSDEISRSNVSHSSLINPGLGSGVDPEIRFQQKVMLFTTKHCPNCPRAKEEMQGTTNLQVIDAEENFDVTRKYGIRSVPAVVVEEAGAYKTYTGISDIIKYKRELNLR
ncbi:MAG TPA: anaerobic ribonucleoside-triphosphate reductase, partial [bacterium]|nr:anaerobic ribonucleoside-triphosphate reductase [bacterium]